MEFHNYYKAPALFRTEPYHLWCHLLVNIYIVFFYRYITALLVDASSKPFSISPPVMANLIKNLYDLNPGTIILFD